MEEQSTSRRLSVSQKTLLMYGGWILVCFILSFLLWDDFKSLSFHTFQKRGFDLAVPKLSFDFDQNLIFSGALCSIPLLHAVAMKFTQNRTFKGKSQAILTLIIGFAILGWWLYLEYLINTSIYTQTEGSSRIRVHLNDINFSKGLIIGILSGSVFSALLFYKKKKKGEMMEILDL
ncbi:hypothetical protein [Phaeocystidibacter marisrubri]|uniref:Uncharacterized protein n=1 Tax=Phaeocystidibacter marisrubri TaxID=1577780 RepID=A0A6L3ZF60_9FLAO|nr:hypothetical protein [Phaeocystidibacter marisrubri]KAB2816246.1 hypothetical protein F8C82_11200 [Phaeocystidibacter marisrubri]